MPGLLDFFTGGADPAQQQGLLAAAAQILQASGPSRTPTSFGQILGGGVGAFQQGQQGYQDRAIQLEQAKQLAQLRDFAIKDKQSDLETQDAQRQRAKKLLALGGDYWKNGGQTPAPAFPGGQSAASLMQSLVSGQGLPATQQAQAPAPAAAAGLDRGSMTNQRLAYAQYLRQNGFGQEAQAEEDSALKVQPKVKGWEKVQVAGKVLFAPFFEDGTSGQPVPLEVAEKLDTVNRGGTTDMVNPITGATVRSMTNSASPDAQMSAATAGRRLAFDQQQAGKPIFNAEAGGFVLPPSSANPGGKLLPISGINGKAPTEFQGKSAAFGLRATEADKILRSLDGQYSPGGINSKNALGSVWGIGGALGAGANSLLSDSSQQADQAQRDFINAILRQESGAAIGAQEFDNAAKQYFPQPGDSAAVKVQKQRARQLAIQGLQANAGKAALTAPATAGGWSIMKVE